MAFDLDVSPEFFIGPHDLDGVDFDKERPTTVYQAILAMDEGRFGEMAREVFGCEPEFVDTEMVLDKIRETGTCRDIRTPVEVYIDPENRFSVVVYEEPLHE